MAVRPGDAVLVRTHFFNGKIRRLVRRYRQYFGDAVHVVCPTRVLETVDRDVPCVAVDPDRVDALGLHRPPRWEWQCGDYALHLARAALPQVRRFWMIEYDVWINTPHLADFFDRFGDDDADFVAARLRPAEPDWYWRESMEGGPHEVQACLFSMVRVSAPALDRLLDLRRAASITPAERWPNDEVFVATHLVGEGWRCRDLGPAEGVTEESFSFERPHSQTRIFDGPRDGLVYHPVRAKAGFVAKARLFAKVFPERVEEIVPELAIEGDAIEVEMVRDLARGPQPPEATEVRLEPGEEGEPTVVHARIDDRDYAFAVAEPTDVVQSFHVRGAFYEWPELQIIARHLPPGAVYCDVGANVGNHVIFVADRLAPSKIVAFEPNPVARELLLRNLRLNRLEDRVDLSKVEFGLGRATARASLSTPPNNLGGTMLDVTDADGSVEVRAGDDLLAGERVDFLKIDVEGMELDVLEGLAATIARCRPVVFVEVLNEAIDDVLAWADRSGYEPAETHRRYRACKNFLLVPREARPAGAD